MPEIRRLFAVLDAPAEERAERLTWSIWRRRHQAGAQRCHQARRERAHGQPATSWPAATERDVLPAPSEAQWAAILALLAETDRAAHRPPLPHRPILEGILWMMAHNTRWEDIPPQFGAHTTIATRYNRWRKRGVWARIVAVLCPPPPEPAPT